MNNNILLPETLSSIILSCGGFVALSGFAFWLISWGIAVIKTKGALKG